jgi:GntP family permease.
LSVWMKRLPSRLGPSWKRWSAAWVSSSHWSSPSLP